MNMIEGLPAFCKSISDLGHLITCQPPKLLTKIINKCDSYLYCTVVLEIGKDRKSVKVILTK